MIKRILVLLLAIGMMVSRSDAQTIPVEVEYVAEYVDEMVAQDVPVPADDRTVPIVIYGCDTGFKSILWKDRVEGDLFIDTCTSRALNYAKAYLCISKRWKRIEDISQLQHVAGYGVRVITPEQYGAVQAQKTHAQLGRSIGLLERMFGDTIGSLSVDNLADEDALRMCARKSKWGHTCTALSPGSYYVQDNGMVYPSGAIGRVQSMFMILGNGAEIKVVGSKPITVIGRDDVADIGVANSYVNNALIIRDLIITGNGSCIGFRPKYSYNSLLDNCFINNCKWAAKFEFSLYARVRGGNYTNNKNLFDVGLYNVKGSNWSNSQSNSTSIETRIYCGSCDTAIKATDVSGLIWSGICEGVRIRYGLVLYAPNNTVVRELTVRNMHFEVVNGADSAFIKATMREGTIILDTYFGQYQACLIDAKATTGIVHVNVSNIAYSVKPKEPKKQFMNDGCSWTISNHHALNTETYPQYFGGVAVKLFTGGLHGGRNMVQIINIPK